MTKMVHWLLIPTEGSCTLKMELLKPSVHMNGMISMLEFYVDILGLECQEEPNICRATGHMIGLMPMASFAWVTKRMPSIVMSTRTTQHMECAITWMMQQLIVTLIQCRWTNFGVSQIHISLTLTKSQNWMLKYCHLIDWLIVGCLRSSGKFFMHFVDDIVIRWLIFIRLMWAYFFKSKDRRLIYYFF